MSQLLFLIFDENLEASQQDLYKKYWYTQHIFLWKNKNKNLEIFLQIQHSFICAIWYFWYQKYFSIAEMSYGERET